MTSGLRFKFNGSTVGVAATFAADSPANAITAISKANPAVVTDAGHGHADGDVIKIAGVVGMTEVNGKTYIIDVVDANSFKLLGEDSTGFATYASGGTYTIATYSSFCELTSYNNAGGSSPEIDATTICSIAAEFDVGLPNYGTTQLDYNLAPLQTIQAALKAAHAAGTIVAVKVTLPGTGGKMVQLGFVQQYSSSGSVGANWRGSMTIRNTGNREDFA